MSEIMVLDRARAQWIDKFSSLPATPSGRERRPNARFYYRVLAAQIAASLAGRPWPDALELERLARGTFRRFAVRHFYRSVCDCYRRFAGLRSRYVWKSLILWLPREIGGRQRRAWLESHVGEVHPWAYGEQERVQEIIDRHCANRRVVSLDDVETPDQPGFHSDLPWSLEYGISTFGLANTLAVEKSVRIKEQRPGIAALGPERLHALVLRIFDDLACGTYRPTVIADEFGLDRATFSRFAGFRWREGSVSGIPDLFRNLAQVVSKDPRWAECAREAGLWPRIEDVLQKMMRPDHE